MVGDVGKRIQATRAAAGLSQQALADAVSTNVMQVSKWERGVVLPNANSLDALSAALGVSVDYLLGRSDDPAGPVLESALSDYEAHILRLIRRRDVAALNAAIRDIGDQDDQQGITRVDKGALDDGSGGGGE